MGNAFLMHNFAGNAEINGFEFRSVKITASNTESNPVKVYVPVQGNRYTFCAMQYGGTIGLTVIGSLYGNQYYDVTAMNDSHITNDNTAGLFHATYPRDDPTSFTVSSSVMPTSIPFSTDTWVKIWHDIDTSDYKITSMDITIIYWWWPM